MLPKFFSFHATWITLILSFTSVTEETRAGSIDEVLPHDTFAFVSLDAGALEDGLAGLGLVQLLGESEVRDFLKPLTSRFLGPTDDLVTALLDRLPTEQFVTGRVEAGLAGLVLEFTDAAGNVTRERLSPSQPIRSRLLHRMIGVTTAVNGMRMASARVMVDFLISIDSGPALHHQATQQLARLPREISQRTVTIAGKPVTELTAPLPNQSSLSVYLYATPERWILAGDPQRIESALAGSAQKSLASTEAYRTSRKQVLAGKPIVHVYANAQTLLETARPLVPPLLFDELELLGLSTFEGVSYGMSMVDGSVRDSLRISVEPKGVFSLLNGFGGGLRGLDAAPPGSLAFAGFRFDLAKAYDQQLDLTADVLLPGGKQQLRGIVHQMADQLSPIGSLDDVLAALGDEIDITISSMTGLFPNLIVTYHLGDEAKFATMFERLQAIATDRSRGRMSFRDVKVGDLDGKVLGVPGAPFQPAMAIQDGKLHIALLGAFNLRTHLSGQQPAAPAGDSNDAMARLRRTIPTEDLSMLAYLNLEKLLPVGYGVAMPMLTMRLSQTDTGLDPAMVPSAATVSRHFSAMALAMSRDENGVSLHSLSPAGMAPMLGLVLGTAVRGQEVEAELVPFFEEEAAPEKH